MIKVFEGITALKKAATKREAERKELADVVTQEKLIEIKGEYILLSRGLADESRSKSLSLAKCLPSSCSGRKENRWEYRDSSERYSFPTRWSSKQDW